jgi:hypothetical protein
MAFLVTFVAAMLMVSLNHFRPSTVTDISSA